RECSCSATARPPSPTPAGAARRPQIRRRVSPCRRRRRPRLKPPSQAQSLQVRRPLPHPLLWRERVRRSFRQPFHLVRTGCRGQQEDTTTLSCTFVKGRPRTFWSTKFHLNPPLVRHSSHPLAGASWFKLK